MDILESKKDEKDISISEIARQLGMAKSAISRYFNRTREFPLNKIEDISKILDLDSKYVLGFTEYNDITVIYNKLNDIRQKKVYHYASNQLDEQNQVNESTTIYVTSKLSAGPGVIDLDPSDVEEIDYSGYVPRHDLAFQVAGDSMQPMFEDGEIVFVERTTDVRNGQIIAVQINEEAFIKKAYIEDDQLRLVSLNSNYGDIYANDKDDIRIIGRVIL